MFKVFMILLTLAFAGINAQPLLPNWYLETSYKDFTDNPVMFHDLMNKISARIAKAGYRSVDISYSSWEIPDNPSEMKEKKPYLKINFDNQGREVLRIYNILWRGGNDIYLTLLNYNNKGLIESFTTYDQMVNNFSTVSVNYFYTNGNIVKVLHSDKETGEIIKELSFQYDELNRLISVISDELPVEYKYDGNTPDSKLRTLIHYNGFLFFNIMYKPNGRIESYSYSGGNGSTTYIDELFYVGDETFPMELVSYRKGIVAHKGREYKYSYEYKYDEFGNLTEIRFTEEQPDEKGEVKSEKVTLYQFNYK